MAAETAKPKNKGGRPRKHVIDWKRVSDWIQNFYTINEIARYVGMHAEQLRKEIKRHYRKSYAEVRQELEAEKAGQVFRLMVSKATRGDRWAVERMLDLHHAPTRRVKLEDIQAAKAAQFAAIQINAPGAPSQDEVNPLDNVVVYIPEVAPQSTEDDIKRLIADGADVDIVEV